MASNTTGSTITLPVLGDPMGMRPSENRYWAGYIGEHTLADDRLVWVTWVPYNKTHCHIIVWDEDEVWTVEKICRLQAAQETEKLLQQLES